MSKTYFMRIFDSLWKILRLSILLEILSLMVKLLTFFISKLQNTELKLDLITDINFLNSGSHILGNVAIALFIVFILMISKEAIYRIRYDNLLNLPKSMSGTFKIRKFLAHHEIIKKDEEHPQINQTVEKYNKAVSHVVIDIWNSQLMLYLKLPKEYQAQKMLKDMEAEIKEEIASAYPDYLISTFEREKNSLCLKGTLK
ncbi:hypothetical protein [Lactococcus lactis]|uniref:Alkaline shock response membrane anchor protein AmaP n=1 Tax=Lactococcus lactis subsp. lactis NCDO 2118 TaxID=1117941 RepID=A0ABC8A4K0_LACLL|nr:hypothetical protein [Lactococcus lactis]ADA64368.1 Hypothetical protein LLKF_0613 [Lactococcus lactis subsp. lactis KF147]AII12111.1 Hypothetical protein NCDO2118_0615 [Lactococcus lactis subsp. lactis NCDO 2118]